ncbi:cutinase family protein [Cryobacterium sp. TMT1-19]|uniref:cutinase family protein n=1 Tax=Cryobacterium sp. TMT1-19 TaxID=1259231 RepID=UPI00141BDA56|nr:cutinase family protein [Cryobacterium sp. TMT1-19]
MSRRTTLFLSVATAITTLIASIVIVPAALAVDPLSNPCGDVETVFARGSGQAVGDPESERFFAQLQARIGTTLTINPYELGDASIDGSQYPAVPVGGDTWDSFWNTAGAFFSAGGGWTYGASVDSGVEELRSYLTSRAATCPEAAFVLGGFSQGAQVVGETYVEKLTPALRNRVVYQALFGDPRLSLPEGLITPGGSQTGYAPACLGNDSDSEWRFDVPDCFVKSGSLGARQPYLPESFTSTTGLSCAKHDYVCGSSKLIWDAEGHKTYKKDGGSIDKAAVEMKIFEMLAVWA